LGEIGVEFHGAACCVLQRFDFTAKFGRWFFNPIGLGSDLSLLFNIPLGANFNLSPENLYFPF
jgi:hypothetical protein